MGLPAPDGTIAWNGKVPPEGGIVVVIESVYRSGSTSLAVREPSGWRAV